MSNWNAQTDLNAVKDTVVQGTKKVRAPFSALCPVSPLLLTLWLCFPAGEHGDGFLQLDGELVVSETFHFSNDTASCRCPSTLPCGYDHSPTHQHNYAATITTPTRQAPKTILSLSLSSFLVLL
mgnify:CR=1 FL=1